MSRSVAPEGALPLVCLPAPPGPKAGEFTRLSTTEIAALTKAREARWRPGLAKQPLHSEIFASADDASGAGLALALARDALRIAGDAKDPLAQDHDRRQVLWVQESKAIQLSGRPYLHGLPTDLRNRLIHVEAKTPEDALFALEEGLRCRDLACVIGEIAGNPRALDFTASRRLSLAAEKHSVALWLVRLEAKPDLSSARMRWRVEAVPSSPPCWNDNAPGDASWNAELFRARSHAPGRWIISDENSTLRACKPEHISEDDGKHRHIYPFKKGQSGPAPGPAPGLVLARRRRLRRQGKRSAAPDPRHLVCQTVGRSLAAYTRP